jgi:hypothetical protein
MPDGDHERQGTVVQDFEQVLAEGFDSLGVHRWGSVRGFVAGLRRASGVEDSFIHHSFVRRTGMKSASNFQNRTAPFVPLETGRRPAEIRRRH